MHTLLIVFLNRLKDIVDRWDWVVVVSGNDKEAYLLRSFPDCSANISHQH